MQLACALSLLLASSSNTLPTTTSGNTFTQHTWSPTYANISDTEESKKLVDEYLFHITLDEFQARRAARDPPELDWTSDDCTNAPQNPLNYHFGPACQRHDFGYRNYKRERRFNVLTKLLLDNNFRADMIMICGKIEGGLQRRGCHVLAWIYYKAARNFGLKKQMDSLAEDNLPRGLEGV